MHNLPTVPRPQSQLLPLDYLANYNKLPYPLSEEQQFANSNKMWELL